MTCREAIAHEWPQALQDGALTVLVHEDRSENPGAIGAPNNDGSRDFGCMQINDHAHPDFFAACDWSNADQNVKFAYGIYEGRKQKTGNGWEAWYSVSGILW